MKYTFVIILILLVLMLAFSIYFFNLTDSKNQSKSSQYSNSVLQLNTSQLGVDSPILNSDLQTPPRLPAE